MINFVPVQPGWKGFSTRPAETFDIVGWAQKDSYGRWHPCRWSSEKKSVVLAENVFSVEPRLGLCPGI